MGQVERMDDGLAHIGVGVAGQAPQPGLDRVQGLADSRKAAPIDDPFGGAQLRVHLAPVSGHHRHCGGDIAE